MKYPDASDLLRRWFFILPFAGNWNYDNPDTWPATNPQCGGFQQSPIAIYSEEAQFHSFRHLQFFNYKKPLSAPVEVINNGYSAEVGLRINEDQTKPSLTVGGFNDLYEVQAVHFHWGSDGIPGSEHTIDDEKYDLEMHIVHKNYKYQTVEDARNFPDGFVVLAVLLDAVPDEESEKHRTLDEIYNALERIKEYNNTAEILGPITMESFISGLNKHDFFNYKGSLTTPPCSESVLWFVFTDVLPIAFDNLKRFWNLQDADGEPLINNFRPLQPGNRAVYRKRGKRVDQF